MSRRQKHRTATVISSDSIRTRIERALGEGRSQQALELAKQLYKSEPTDGHKLLLRRAALERASQLRMQGYTRDALSVLGSVLQLTGRDGAWLEQVAELMGACGDWKGALELIPQGAGSPAQARVLTLVADSAAGQGPAGRAHLPETLRPSFDLIIQAFRQLEAGNDDEVKQTLQGIGLQSPFLEWKVLIRGLQAFYQRDDARAIENWQRLDAQRMPARVTAPLRFQIDPDFRRTQPPETQNRLQKQADRMQDSGLVQQLRSLQALLADPEELSKAFRQADGLLSALRQQAPQLVPRLAACFYWTIIMHGQPEDVPRYARVFGEPADEPGLHRLRALLAEHACQMQDAQNHWRDFERSVAANATVWPSSINQRVRALVWRRMGENGATVPDLDKMPELPPFLRDHPSRPRPLKPPPEECFEQSLKLAPDELKTYEALLEYYQHTEKPAKAETAARRLLEHFPDHVPTLEALAGLRNHEGDATESLALLQRALHLNPLDRDLRAKVSTAHLFVARNYAEAGRFDEARAEYQAALAHSGGGKQPSILCKMAACEFKAGNPARAEELLQEAQVETGNRLAIDYSMLIEIIRLKLPGALKNRFNKEFNAGLAEPPTGKAANVLATATSIHLLAGVTYHGQKTHIKKVLTYLEKALKAPFTARELEETCIALQGLDAPKLLQRYTAYGRKLFPDNPRFYLLEADSYLRQGPYGFSPWQVKPLLDKARQLAQAMSGNPEQKELLEEIDKRQQMLGFMSPLFGGPGMFGDMFGMFGDEMDEDYDDDEYDDDDW